METFKAIAIKDFTLPRDVKVKEDLATVIRTGVSANRIEVTSGSLVTVTADHKRQGRQMWRITFRDIFGNTYSTDTFNDRGLAAHLKAL